MKAPEYLEEQKDRALRNSRIAAVFATIAIMIFALLDTVVYPHLVQDFLLIRLGVVAVSIVLFALTWVPGARNYGREIGMVQYVVTALSIVLMIHLSEGYLSPYYAGINVILIVFLAILPMDHIRAMIICGIIYTAYLVPILMRGNITEWSVFANNNSFLLATIILAVVSSYMSTRLRYKEFSARFSLAMANEELKHLDVMKSQFFANVSHEVRTPLTSIIGPVQSMYQGDAGDINDVQKRLLSQVYRNGLRLLDMINQMLDFARFDARKMKVRLTEMILEDVVQDTVTAFQDVAVQKSLTLDYEIESEVSAVYLDREKIERVITNLLRNAVKFTDEGGITIRSGQEGDYVVVSVEDTGIGIPANQVATIFERFQQVDSSSTRRYEGTGLGLTIVKEAVEIQGGDVDVRSTPGEGTVFTVRLPRNLEETMPEAISNRTGRDRRRGGRRRDGAPYTGPERRQGPRRVHDFARVDIADMVFMESEELKEEATASAPEASARDGFSVLYVEDNMDLRSYVSTMLTRSGHRVAIAVDGQDGWEKLDAFNPDVVVSDIMMPRLDGYDLMNRMREDARYRCIPIILTTAKSETEERIKGLEEGADDYLAKPIHIRELDARIRNLITRRLFQEALARTEELERRMQDLTLGFSRSLDLRDHYTADHSNDVLHYGTIIAEEMDIPVDAAFRDAMLLHDLGKLGVPDRVLLKEGPLDDDEWRIMKKHAEFGAHLLAEFDSFRDVSEIVLSHQERYDGTGYPRGLKGGKIPLTARIIAVADAWHAMIEDRPYRKALEMSQAVCEITRGRGTHFDPSVVDAFITGLSRRGLIDVSMC
ncbi:MAG: ATP-binding protein [Spirochaeta sp.]|jgi:response regulator RpfG family c-di-GMP phosphodiesterase/signal transduction histidine kinase|nr:ATP-binding protein [Spirochaeta sp.]